MLIQKFPTYKYTINKIEYKYIWQSRHRYLVCITRTSKTMLLIIIKAYQNQR